MENVVGRTKHGELTLDQIAELMPGMAELMAVLGQRYQVMYHAARGDNWKLAAYQLGAIRKIFNASKVTRPKYAVAMDQFASEFLDPIAEAIRRRDWDLFKRGVQASIEASDDYHRQWGYEYIRFRISERPPAGYNLDEKR